MGRKVQRLGLSENLWTPSPFFRHVLFQPWKSVWTFLTCHGHFIQTAGPSFRSPSAFVCLFLSLWLRFLISISVASSTRLLFPERVGKEKSCSGARSAFHSCSPPHLLGPLIFPFSLFPSPSSFFPFLVSNKFQMCFLHSFSQSWGGGVTEEETERREAWRARGKSERERDALKESST